MITCNYDQGINMFIKTLLFNKNTIKNGFIPPEELEKFKVKVKCYLNGYLDCLLETEYINGPLRSKLIYLIPKYFN